MGVKLLTPEEINKERLANMTRTYGRVNRVISGRFDLEVAVRHGGPAPAWSDGRTVTFNSLAIGSITDLKSIVELTGLNYHELSHIIFTPRENSWFMYKFLEKAGKTDFVQMKMALNILEDQRIETLMIGMYAAVAPYFKSTFMRYCLADQNQWKTNHLLAHGRRYLPAEFREEFRNRFERPELLQAFEDIIDEYRMLPIDNRVKTSRAASRGLKLVTEFYNLLSYLTTPGDPNCHADRPERFTQGTTDNTDQQKEAAEAAEYNEWEEEDDDDDQSSDVDGDDGEGDDGVRSEDDGDGDSSEDSGSDEGDDSDEDGSGSGDSAGDSDGEGDGSGDEGDADSDSGDGQGGRPDGDSDGEDDGATSVGSGTGTGTPTDDGAFRKALEENRDSIMNDAEVLRDAKDKQRQIVDGDGRTDPTLSKNSWRLTDIDPTYFNAASKFAKEMERIVADLDPGWKTHKPAGRLNIQRAMSGDDIDVLYDQWDEGVNDVTDIECVVLIDRSGSMNMVMNRASQAMWAIKRAMDKIDASTTVLAFESSCSVVYWRDEKALPQQGRTIGSAGGTAPEQAIREAMRIFQNTRRKSYIFIAITDGEWTGNEKCEAAIEKMNAAGIVTALCYINTGSPYSVASKNTHQCQVFQKVDSPADLINFAKPIVKEVMKGMRR